MFSYEKFTPLFHYTNRPKQYVLHSLGNKTTVKFSLINWIFLNPKYQPWETLLQWFEIKIFLSPLLRVDGQWCYQDLSSHGGSHHCYTVYYILCQNCSQSHAMNNAKDIGREGAQKDCYSQQCADSTPENARKKQNGKVRTF